MTRYKTVFIAGIWDLCHRGHINILQRARELGEKLVVIIHDDRSCYLIKGKIPVQGLKQRVKNLKILGFIDQIIITKKTDPYKAFIKVMKKYGEEDLAYVRGDDLQQGFPGQWLLERRGTPIVYIPYTKGVSSTYLREQLENEKKS